MSSRAATTKRNARGVESPFQIVLDPYLKQLLAWNSAEEIEARFLSRGFVARLKDWKTTCFDADGHEKWLLEEFSKTGTAMLGGDWDNAVKIMKAEYANINVNNVTKLFEENVDFFSEFVKVQPHWCFEMCIRILITAYTDLRSRPKNGYFFRLLEHAEISPAKDSQLQIPQKRGVSPIVDLESKKQARRRKHTRESTSTGATSNKQTANSGQLAHTLSVSRAASEIFTPSSSDSRQKTDSSRLSALFHDETEANASAETNTVPTYIDGRRVRSDKEVDRVWKESFLQEKEKNVKLQVDINKMQAEMEGLREILGLAEDARDACEAKTRRLEEEVYRLEEHLAAIRRTVGLADPSE